MCIASDSRPPLPHTSKGWPARKRANYRIDEAVHGFLSDSTELRVFQQGCGLGEGNGYAAT